MGSTHLRILEYSNINEFKFTIEKEINKLKLYLYLIKYITLWVKWIWFYKILEKNSFLLIVKFGYKWLLLLLWKQFNLERPFFANFPTLKNSLRIKIIAGRFIIHSAYNFPNIGVIIPRRLNTISEKVLNRKIATNFSRVWDFRIKP